MTVWAAGLSLAVLVAVAVLAPWLAPHPPAQQSLTDQFGPISADHLLGTDNLGRDVLSRIIVGSRTALAGSFLVALGAMLLGNLVGLAAGYLGGRVDAVLMRTVDVVYAVPGMLVAIVVAGVVGGGYLVAVAILAVIFSPYDARASRTAAQQQRSAGYVEAARLLAVPTRRILIAHIWPNVLPVTLATALLNFSFALISLSSLSFLGVGVAPGSPDWGRMLSEGREYLFDNPLPVAVPAALIVLTAAAASLLGDWADEHLTQARA